MQWVWMVCCTDSAAIAWRSWTTGTAVHSPLGTLDEENVKVLGEAPAERDHVQLFQQSADNWNPVQWPLSFWWTRFLALGVAEALRHTQA